MYFHQSIVIFTEEFQRVLEAELFFAKVRAEDFHVVGCFVFVPNGVNRDCDEYRLDILDGFLRQHMLRKLTNWILLKHVGWKTFAFPLESCSLFRWHASIFVVPRVSQPRGTRILKRHAREAPTSSEMQVRPRLISLGNLRVPTPQMPTPVLRKKANFWRNCSPPWFLNIWRY